MQGPMPPLQVPSETSRIDSSSGSAPVAPAPKPALVGRRQSVSPPKPASFRRTSQSHTVVMAPSPWELTLHEPASAGHSVHAVVEPLSALHAAAAAALGCQKRGCPVQMPAQL
jgi:hypothetical protein